MSLSIHNLTEICDQLIHRIDNLVVRVAKLEGARRDVGQMTEAPQIDTSYWVTVFDKVDEFIWVNSFFDRKCLADEQCYKTREAAQAALDVIKAKEASYTLSGVEWLQYEADKVELTELREFVEALKAPMPIKELTSNSRFIHGDLRVSVVRPAPSHIDSGMAFATKYDAEVAADAHWILADWHKGGCKI